MTTPTTVTVGTTPTFLSAIGTGITVKNTGHEAVTIDATQYVKFGEGQELAPGAHAKFPGPGILNDLYAVTKTGTTTLTVTPV